MYLFVALFLLMMGNFIYYVQVKSIDDINNSYNTRQENLAAMVIRGSILASDGQVIARTVTDEKGQEKREYPFGPLFAHVAGYSTKGRLGLESMANISLLTSNAQLSEKISNEVAEEKNIGDNIITTLDVDLQRCAFEALGIYKGAIVAMDPTDGRILAMVSNPGFDPNTIAADWDELNARTDTSPLLNRVTLGLYPPGSTFKIVTLLEYLRENDDPEAYSFNCKGSFTFDGVTVNCYHGSVHGQIGLKRSFAKSCNSSFANIGSMLDNKSFNKTARDLLFDSDLPLKIPYKQSSFPLVNESDTEEKLHCAIGQGKILASPIHICMITAAIANGGMLRKPYLIDRIENYTGDIVKQYHPADHKRLMSSDEAGSLMEYMEAVVSEGTGSKLSGQDYTVAGKTGSAEFGDQKGESHAWFTGYAHMEGEEGKKIKPLVITVLVEGAGSGSDYAVPMAKRLFDEYENR